MNGTWKAGLSARRRWLVLLLIAGLGAWIYWSTGPADAAKPTPATTSRSKAKRGVSAAPHHVSLKALTAQREVTAGTQGTLDLELIIAVPKDHRGQPLRWNPKGRKPTLTVQVPPESGIQFTGPGKGSRSQTTLEFEVSRPDHGVITARIPYTVSSRVRVKTYPLKIHIAVPLITADGMHIRDSGTVSVPVRVATPLSTKLLVLGILAIAVFLFIVEWVRVDVVAMLMMVSLPLLNLLPSRETFTGLSSNAVVAIIGVMIVSAGLNRVGLVSRAVKPMIRAAGKSATKLQIYLSSLIALISSVMQNTGAAVLFLPGIQNAAKVMKFPVSKVLMPIGMCAILGGTITMIGTSPLILLNDILPEGVEKFGLLELTPIGLAFVVTGILYFSTVGGKFLTRIAEAQRDRGDIGDADLEVGDAIAFYELDGPFELRVPSDWSLPEGPDTMSGIRLEYGVSIVAMAADSGTREMAPKPTKTLRADTSLCVYGQEGEVKRFVDAYGLEILNAPDRMKRLFNPAVTGVVEAVVSPRSDLVGRTIREIGFRDSFGVTTLALHREAKTYYKEKSDIALMSGDVLLLHASWDHLKTLQAAHQNIRIITPLEADTQEPAKSKLAITCFGIALTMMIVSSFYFQKLPYNPIPLSVCLMVGAVGMVVTGVLTVQDAYKAVDWRTVFLLGGLIPLGMAVDRTGTAEWIATGVVSALGESVTPLVLIAVLAVLSTVFCLVISNVGACTLLVPLGASMAHQIGVDPRVAAIVVGLGVSNSFILPTHQVNALYMGPGSYRTKDYIKIGGIMSALYIVVLVVMTYLFYT